MRVSHPEPLGPSSLQCFRESWRPEGSAGEGSALCSEWIRACDLWGQVPQGRADRSRQTCVLISRRLSAGADYISPRSGSVIYGCG